MPYFSENTNSGEDGADAKIREVGAWAPLHRAYERAAFSYTLGLNGMIDLMSRVEAAAQRVCLHSGTSFLIASV
jgi:hypothetical protein